MPKKILILLPLLAAIAGALLCPSEEVPTRSTELVECTVQPSRKAFVDVVRASGKSDPYFVPPPTVLRRGVRRPEAVFATFDVSYHGFPPEAQTAFQYAADILESYFTSNITIHIDASWQALGADALGSCIATAWEIDFDAATEKDTFFTIAHAEKLAHENLNGSDAEMNIKFNSENPSWYFGTDGATPANKHDFVQVALHEICHGLGFTGSFGYDCLLDGQGCWGILDILSVDPLVFDRAMYNGKGEQLVDILNFFNPSASLGEQITGGNIFFRGLNTVSAKIYAPPRWDQGSSMAHLDEIFNKTPDALRTYAMDMGEAVHALGPVTQNIFRDMAWLIIPEAKKLWGSGNNLFGQIGNNSGSIADQPVPVNVPGVGEITEISAGAYHSAAAKRDGSFWTWGKNDYGQLGSGTTQNRAQPAPVGGFSDILSISCGTSHTLALRANGTVIASGFNYYGQLGDGTSADRHSPVQVQAAVKLNDLTCIVQLSAGDYHSLALGSNGKVYGWGWNGLGQIGSNGGEFVRRAVQIAGLADIRKIAAGGHHNIAIDKSGNVVTWGSNLYGQIGNGSTATSSGMHFVDIHNAIEVAAGAGHSLALRTNGTVSAWGLNDWGQLGLGISQNRLSPAPVPTLAGIKSIGAGSWHSYAITDHERAAYMWGRNANGDLGLGIPAQQQAQPYMLSSVRGIRSIDGGYHYTLMRSDFPLSPPFKVFLPSVSR